MKRTIVRIGLACCLLLGVFLFSGAALAQDEPQLPDPGLLPDSPFYFLDKLGKNIGLFFAFGDEAKTDKALQYAGERLAEALEMKARNEFTRMEGAAGDYDGYMAQVQTRLEATVQNGSSDNVSERVALATRLHLTVLDNLSDNLTQPKAVQAIIHAREASVNGQEQALRALARNRAEAALRIAGDTIDAHLEQIRVRTEMGFSGNLTGELNIADRLTALENELTAKAEEQGIDVTAIQEHLAQATTQRLEVLSNVYEKVAPQAQQAIGNAVENSFRMYERAIDSLGVSDNTTSDNTTSAAAVLHGVSAQVKEKLGLSAGPGNGPVTMAPDKNAPDHPVVAHNP